MHFSLESQRLREVRISVGEQEKPESGKDGQESQTSTLQPGYQLDCAILGDQTGIEDLCSSSKEKQELDPHLLLQIKSMADAIAEQYHGLVSNAGSVQTDRALAGRQPQENKDQGGLLACHGQQTNMITSFYRDLTSCNITGFNKTSNTKMFDIPHDHLEKTNHGYVGFEDDLTELTWDCTIPSVKEDLNSLEKLRKLRSLLSKAETQSLEDQSVREAEASVREAEDKFAAYLQNIRLRGII